MAPRNRKLAGSHAPSGDESYLQSLVVRDQATGLREIHLCAGGRDVGRLKDAILGAFQDTLDTHLDDADFGGLIAVVILAEMTRSGAGVWRAMKDLEEHLAGLAKAAHLWTRRGTPVQVRVEYTDPERG